jgi:ClpP class serine protease
MKIGFRFSISAATAYTKEVEGSIDLPYEEILNIIGLSKAGASGSLLHKAFQERKEKDTHWTEWIAKIISSQSKELTKNTPALNKAKEEAQEKGIQIGKQGADKTLFDRIKKLEEDAKQREEEHKSTIMALNSDHKKELLMSKKMAYGKCLETVQHATANKFASREHKKARDEALDAVQELYDGS